MTLERYASLKRLTRLNSLSSHHTSLIAFAFFLESVVHQRSRDRASTSRPWKPAEAHTVPMHERTHSAPLTPVLADVTARDGLSGRPTIRGKLLRRSSQQPQLLLNQAPHFDLMCETRRCRLSRLRSLSISDSFRTREGEQEHMVGLPHVDGCRWWRANGRGDRLR